MKSFILTAVVALLAGFGGAALWSATGWGHENTRAYLLDNPEILPELAQAFDRKQAAERLAGIAKDVATPFPGAVLGNPNGTVTLVEFTDYGCGFCRSSRADVAAVIADNPDLRVVVREWPIFEGSELAARMALAAAKQGKFPAFHDALFKAGPPSEATIARAAKTAELDISAAQEFAMSSDVDMEIAKTSELARRLAFTGTPSWVVEGQILQGAVGKQGLQHAIDMARSDREDAG